MVTAAMKLKCLLLGRKVMTNLDSILKNRDITLPTKVHIIKPMVFPVVLYGYESWTIKNVENQRIDAFELWCWRRLLRVPWTTKGSNQAILKEISPEYSLEVLMLKLKLQYSGQLREEPTHWKRPWCWWRVNTVAEMCLQTGLSARAGGPCKRGILPKSLDTALSLMVLSNKGAFPSCYKEGIEAFVQTLQ